jgi:ribulose kinase
MKQSGAKPEQIAALCAATTSCTVMTCGKDGSTDDNALLWMDVRAAQQAKAILDATGEAPSAEHFPSKALWIKQNQPERWAKAEVLCEYQDWMNYRLTGRWCFSVNTAINWGYNKRKGGFYRDFYAKFGMEDTFDKMPAEAVCAGEKSAVFLRAGRLCAGCGTWQHAEDARRAAFPRIYHAHQRQSPIRAPARSVARGL